MRFRERSEAGQFLAEQLISYANRVDVLVMALPRGGVPVAFEVARRLHAPLDVWLVRKLGAPGIPELAIGAIASGGVETIATEALHRLAITREQFEAITARERQELQRREAAYRDSRPLVDVPGKTVILIDDGIATGASMRAAIVSLRKLNPAEIVVAVPVASPSTLLHLRSEADAVVCLWTPADLNSVGEWYQDFSQTTDDEVNRLLERARDLIARPDQQAD